MNDTHDTTGGLEDVTVTTTDYDTALYTTSVLYGDDPVTSVREIRTPCCEHAMVWTPNGPLDFWCTRCRRAWYIHLLPSSKLVCWVPRSIGSESLTPEGFSDPDLPLEGPTL